MSSPWPWIIGGGVVVAGLAVLHSVEEEDKQGAKPKAKDSPPAPSSASPPASPPPPGKPAGATSPLPVGTHVQAQDRDGRWYGATVLHLDLTDPDAVKWDPGTPGHERNPKTHTSPASGVRAVTVPAETGATKAAVGAAAKGAPTATKDPHQAGASDALAGLFGDR